MAHLLSISVVVGPSSTAHAGSGKMKMARADEFGKPDRAGFEALLFEPFQEYRGMLFRKSAFDPTLIDRRLQTLPPEEVQREINHTHLFLYAADMQIQRQWTHELEQCWSSRLAAEFPSVRVKLLREERPEEIIVTFWKVSISAEATA
ncbi:MAG: hypothetical protein HY689_05275 [Chloroflexi bacterium]|nr:hypothetical protein [Chloroflexota bacterium]